MSFLGTNTVIGSGGVLSIPLLDIETQQSPVLLYGPNNKRYNFRLIGRLPNEGHITKLPVPMGFDRDNPRFDIESIVSMNDPGRAVDIEIYEVRSTKGLGKVKKKKFYQWDPCPQNRLFPALDISMKMLEVGNTVEVFGVSKCSQRRIGGRLPKLPREQHRAFWSPVLRVKISWMPQAKEQGVQYVKGDPFAVGGINPEELEDLNQQLPDPTAHTRQRQW